MEDKMDIRILTELLNEALRLLAKRNETKIKFFDCL